MRVVQDIYFDVLSQSIYHDAPEGRPSSVTSVTVYRWDQSDTETGESAIGAGSVEANPVTTLDAAAGYGQSDPKNIPLAATTGIVAGRRYLLTSVTNGLKEWVEVEKIVSADTVSATVPLHNTYASSDTFVTTRMTAAVDATWVADSTNIDWATGPNPMFRVRWVYVVSSVTYVADTYFNLVRYAGRHGVTPQDIEDRFSGWMDSLPIDHRKDQGRRLIQDGYRDVKMDLASVDIDDSDVAHAEVIDDMVRLKTIELGEWAKAIASGSDNALIVGGRFDTARKKYTELRDALVRLVTRVPIRNKDGQAMKAQAIGLTVR